MAFAEIDGELVEYDLAPGEEMIVDTGNVAGFEPGVDQHIVLYYDIPGWDTYFGLFGGAAKYQPNGAFSATEHVSKICATNGSTSFTLHSDNGRTSIKMLVRNIQSSVEKEITIGLRGVIEWQGG